MIEITISMLIVIAIMALIMETVDSSLGMMYGTLLSPLLLGYGFDPLILIPALLFSQGIGGIFGTLLHHRHGNADFNGFTRDTKVALAMILPGLAIVILGVFAAVNIPKFYVKFYIASIVIVMSILCLSPITYKFAWWKHIGVGILAAFNKALTGGGFGPVTSTGGIIGGLSAKVSVATTTLGEVGICFGSFLAYMVVVGCYDFKLTTALSIGAIVGGIIGPWVSSIVDHGKLRVIIGLLGVSSGVWLFWRILWT